MNWDVVQSSPAFGFTLVGFVIVAGPLLAGLLRRLTAFIPTALGTGSALLLGAPARHRLPAAVLIGSE